MKKSHLKRQLLVKKCTINYSTNNDFANISNANLLDNSWFTINQRNQINYTPATAGGLTVDRWKIYDDMELSVDSNGVSITSPTHDTNFHQFIESYGEEFVDKPLTLSILLQNGQLVSGTITLTSIPSTYQPFEIYDNNNGLYGGIMVGGTTYAQIYIGVKSGTTLALRAVKLEIGTISTLSMDTVPNYATELLKCQRYFVRYDNNTYDICLVGASYNTGGIFSIPLPTNMRIKPTATLRNIGSFNSNGTQCTHTGVITVDSLVNNILRVYIFVNETLANYTPAIVDLLKIDFSADL